VSFAAFSLGAMFAIAGATIAAVTALYLLRRTPLPRVVSNIEFWMRAMESAKPKWLASFRIPLLAFLFSLAAALGIVLLLGDPRFGSGVRGTTVVVLDAGRSMNAVGIDGERRIDRALTEVRRLVERTTISGEVTIVRAGMRPTVLLPMTSDAHDLDRTLRALELDERPSNIAAGVALADAIIAERGDSDTAQILVITDHEVNVTANSQMAVLPVGTPAQTLAIQAFSARRVPDAVGEYAVRCEIHAFSSEPATARVLIWDGDIAILDERVRVGPRETITLDAGGFSSERAELRAELQSVSIGGSPDGLELDDRAYAVVEALSATRVLLVSEGNRYLEAALAAHPGLDVEVMTPASMNAMSTSDLSPYHALILDGVGLPPGVEHRAVLAFGPSSFEDVALGPSLSEPAVTGTLASHPALDGLRLNDTRITRATPIHESASDRVLLRSDQHALAIARELDRGRLVVFGFDLGQTNLVRSERFPLLLHSALRWIADRTERTTLPRRVGGELVADSGEALRGPDGNEIELPAGILPEVGRSGIWHVGARTVAFSGADDSASLGAGATGGRFLVRNHLPPLAALVAAVLLILLLVEWALLHRGKLE
jgi:hypothetical protein